MEKFSEALTGFFRGRTATPTFTSSWSLGRKETYVAGIMPQYCARSMECMEVNECTEFNKA